MPQYALDQTSEKSFDLLRDGKRVIGIGDGVCSGTGSGGLIAW